MLSVQGPRKCECKCILSTVRKIKMSTLAHIELFTYFQNLSKKSVGNRTAARIVKKQNGENIVAVIFQQDYIFTFVAVKTISNG